MKKPIENVRFYNQSSGGNIVKDMKKVIKTILKIVAVGVGFFAAGKVIFYQNKKITNHVKWEAAYKKYYETLQVWMRRKNADGNISKYLIDNDIKKIGIYGKGVLGEFLYEELKDSEIEVVGFIDQLIEGSRMTEEGLILCGMENIDADMKNCDAIIITPLYDVKAVINELRNKDIYAILLGIDELLNESI